MPEAAFLPPCLRGESEMETICIRNLRFTYPGIDGQPPPGARPVIKVLSLTLHAGDRCLLVGSNGAGKTTILKILGGKHMVEPEMVRVIGRSAFHDTGLTSSGDLCYLGERCFELMMLNYGGSSRGKTTLDEDLGV